MDVVVPSFVAKLARAKKHLVDLDEAVVEFAATHPYTVSERIEGKKKPRKVRRLTFTSDPANTDIPLIAADVVHNLRSSLDHLMSVMVAPKDRRSCMFPIFFQGAWEAIVPGEDQQRIHDRTRWASNVKTLSDEAVAALKLLQPHDTDPQDPELPILPLLNALWNRDKHEKLPIVAAGMAEHRIEFTDAAGVRQRGSGEILDRHVLENNAEILDIPDDAVDVEIYGAPLVGIMIGTDRDKRYVQVPSRLELMAKVIETEIFPLLAPFVRPD